MNFDKEKFAKVVRLAVDSRITRAEEIHRSVADYSIRKLENSNINEETAIKVDKFLDSTIGSIYDLARTINHRSAKLAIDIIRINERNKADDE